MNDFFDFRKYQFALLFEKLDDPLGLYLMLQGLILIFLKQTRDPIERISKLGYFQLISINQKPTDSFINRMEESQDWNNLSKNDK